MDMVGFSFFMFEGIGCVMPVMNASNERARELFPWLLAAGLGTLCLTYICFCEICYANYGAGLNQSIVMQQLPSSNLIVQIVKLAFVGNLLFSYPLTIYPTNIILDEVLFGCLPETSRVRLALETLMRTLVLAAGMTLAVFFYDDLDRILAMSGCLLGTTVVLIVPSVCHYVLITKPERRL